MYLCCCIRYIKRCASNHSIALCRCGGQNWKWGQSAGMRRGSVRSICSIFYPSPQPVDRSFVAFHQPVCEGVRLPQCLQRSETTSLMKCRRSLVGTLSCTTMYHMDAISFDTQAVCRFFHTCIHCVSGCSWFILISRDSLIDAAIICRVS